MIVSMPVTIVVGCVDAMCRYISREVQIKLQGRFNTAA